MLLVKNSRSVCGAGRGYFSGVADDGKKNESDKGFGNATSGHHTVDGINEKLGTKGHEHRRHD